MNFFTCFIGIVMLVCVCGSGSAAQSICYGSTGNGRLEHGVKLPGGGVNFESYSTLAGLLGRTYVHSKVRDVVLSAYEDLQKTQPGKVFKYAETGYRTGGRFKPHKTHQNGLSVDFMVPVIDAEGQSVHLPTHVFNKFGYGVEFNSKGRYDQYRIDFEALGAHIVALHKAALKHGISVRRVLFDPRLQPALYKTHFGEYITKNIQIPKKRSWVRHDEHYHVDFVVQCKPL
jgi:penicillin-insensitive murein endopeptidase